MERERGGGGDLSYILFARCRNVYYINLLCLGTLIKTCLIFVSYGNYFTFCMVFSFITGQLNQANDLRTVLANSISLL